tara:strand:- start:1159 stop:1698 length:540 start_codon:yes stop_codon:yes gene_type:complete
MNYIIEDNFFDDSAVNKLREQALILNYYTKHNHPNGIGDFPGFRSSFFTNLNHDFLKYIHAKVKSHVCKLENIENPKEKYEKYNLQVSFSYTLEGADSYKHKDKTLKNYKVRYGGLVYLHPNPPKNSGTTLYLKDKIYLDNKYNRFVLYNANIEHEPTDNFGTDINNSRLVLTIFYDMA